VFRTSNTVIRELFTRSTIRVTDNNDSGTDWDVNNTGGLNDWFWSNTTWWSDQWWGTGGTIFWVINTGSTIFMTEWTFGLSFNVISSVWTVTTWSLVSVSRTFNTMIRVLFTGDTSVVTKRTVFVISFIVTNFTNTIWGWSSVTFTDSTVSTRVNTFKTLEITLVTI